MGEFFQISPEEGGQDLVEARKKSLKGECRWVFSPSERGERGERTKVVLRWRISTSRAFPEATKQQIKDVLAEEIVDDEIVVESDQPGMPRDSNAEAALDRLCSRLRLALKKPRVRVQAGGRRLSPKDVARREGKRRRSSTVGQRQDRSWLDEEN